MKLLNDSAAKRHLPTGRRWRIGLAIVAMLLQVVVPLAQGVSLAAAADGQARGRLPPAPVCSVSAATTAPVDGYPGAPAAPADRCVLCLVCCLGRAPQDLVPALAATVPPLKTVAWHYETAENNGPAPRRATSRHRPRAPPAFT